MAKKQVWNRLWLATAIISGLVFAFICEANSGSSAGLVETIRTTLTEKGSINELFAALLNGAVLALVGLFIGNLMFRLFKGQTVVRRALSAMSAGLLALVAGGILGFFCYISIWNFIVFMPYPSLFNGDTIGMMLTGLGAGFTAVAGLLFGSGLIQTLLKLDSEA